MVSVMDIPLYYGLNDEKLDAHLLFSDELIDQFIDDGANLNEWVTVFDTSTAGPVDGAASCVNAVSNYLDDAFYYLYPLYRPAAGDAEIDFNVKAWLEVLQLMGVKIVPELYQGVSVPLFAEPTKTESSRVGFFSTSASIAQPNFGCEILTAPGTPTDCMIQCQRAALGSSNKTELFFNIHSNTFRDGDTLKLSGKTGTIANVWIEIGGLVPVGDIRIYTSAKVNVHLYTLDGDTVLHGDKLDGRQFNTLDIIDDDPYKDDPNEGGDKGGDGDSGGKGNHDNTSDIIPFPDIPVNDILSTGLVSLYSPSSGQVRSLASAIFSTNILDQIKQIFSNPMDALISLHFVPVIPSTGGSQNITLGNVNTGVSAPIVTAQYVEVSFGSVTIGEYWGAFSDYSETSVSIFLPYIGFRSLNIQDIMGATVTLKYHVDLLTGAIQAMLQCVKNGKAGSLSSINYTYSGNFLSEIPFQGTHFSNTLGGLLGVGGILAGVGSMILTGGATAPALAGVGGGAVSAIKGFSGKTERSGSAQSTPGSLGVQQAYILVERPIQVTPDNFGKLTGYGSMVGRTLGSFNGLTVVSDARINISRATNSEKDEIMNMLKRGVVV